MEIWVEFDQGKWHISPDPAKMRRGTSVQWQFRMKDCDARRVRWTIYFSDGHPFALRSASGATSSRRLAVVTETFRLSDGQHVGTSPAMAADAAGDYKYGVRLEDLDEDRELGDEDPILIIF